MYTSAKPYFYGTGRRKKSVARVRLYPGTGSIVINGKDIDEYFGLETLKLIINQPLDVTSTVGKYDIVANVVAQKYNVLKTQGNFNNHIGLPLTILKLKDHDALVVEMGMNNLREIAYLSDIANPTLAVITNDSRLLHE